MTTDRTPESVRGERNKPRVASEPIIPDIAVDYKPINP